MGKLLQVDRDSIHGRQVGMWTTGKMRTCGCWSR